MSNPTFELFLNTGTMLDAELQLLEEGADAVPELASLFSGESKNQFGIPYRDLGLPLRCALEVVIRLGPKARPLEPFLREQLEKGDETAARALAALGVLEPASVRLLVKQLDCYPESIAIESALTLIKCGYAESPDVIRALNQSETAMVAWVQVAHKKR
ncbi:hypothetical protein H0484_06410 [Pusillimonas sp. CC-YST705]|uniref:HEAT repeat domain-containing protein n=1 Tax=Mesopusillimonas faecipullorum TaxID=2755040 RepID=A0ABS8CBH6_9BURK|nr:hypothetical protein [Mesopusillimonas faecipullorum]MCB5363381.1 hypothetical protein [Mesopusillimonas faecipullorum]